MRSFTLALLAAAGLVSAQSTSAPVVSNNPIGAQYNANLPDQTKNDVRGSVVARTNPDGKGVSFAVSISGLPAEGGPFMYHIHEKPVPADGNCTGTGAHLDPYKRGEVPSCDASKKETCQVGDLSGKYGNITGRSLSANYVDQYLSTNPSDPAYFGRLSVVVHLSNKTRISCANFTTVSEGAVSSSRISSGTALPSGTATGNKNNTLSVSASSTATGSGTKNGAEPTATPPSPSSPSAQPSSGAGKMLIGAGALVAGVFAFLA